MAGYKYFTVLTDVGKQKLAEAIVNETALDFTEMAVGDSNGTSYDPTSDMTALKHVTYRAAIGSMKINAEDKNIMEFEFVVPSSTGGFYVREAGLYSSDGTLIAISRLPEQYKADMAEGAGSSMTVRILVAISSDAQIYITVPASITYATQTYVAEEFKKHKAEENPHTGYVLVETYSEKITELENSLAGKADSNHRHDDLYSNINHAHSNYAASSHRHDDLYSNINHAHSNYAASSHSHAFSAITGTMAITDSRLTGNLPVARVTGAAGKPTHYTTSAGTWVETPLLNGSVMLEGWGVIPTQSKIDKEIQLPKTLKANGVIVAIGIYGGVFGWYGTLLGLTNNTNNTVTLIVQGQQEINHTSNWYIKGILA